MTYKQIETSREVRLWITQIVVPITTTVIAAGIAIPEVRQAVVTKCKQVTTNISKKLKKKEKKKRVIKDFELNDNTWFMFDKKTGTYRIKRL